MPHAGIETEKCAIGEVLQMCRKLISTADVCVHIALRCRNSILFNLIFFAVI